MRLLSGMALFAALMSTLLMPAAAAPSSQMADGPAILEATARAMDAAQSMRFSGSIDMNVSSGGSPVAMNLPMSGAYQAPDRMSMSVQMPRMGTSMDMIMVGGQMWMRNGQGEWKAQRMSEGAYASPLGMSHADWFRDFTDVNVTDLGAAYRVAAIVDVSQALSAGYSGALGPGRSGAMPFDMSAAGSQVTLTIDKASSYMVSMQLELSMPMPDLAASMTMTMNLTFSDFNGMAVEILPPV